MKKPILQFDFHHDSILFMNPVEIIQTNEQTEISDCLYRVQTAINNGYYVAGYLSYEVTYSFFNHIHTNKKNEHPFLWFGVFNGPVAAPNNASNSTDYSIGTWKMRQTKAQYETQFVKIMDAIQHGTIEQINYTVPFDAHFSGDTTNYYERLKRAQKSAYNAYLQLGNIDILSASPELFFEVKDQTITVKPMKGTIHRGKSTMEDKANKQWLQQSTKNQHENDLIVELMREELLPITIKNSVSPTSLYDIEKYPTVYQMTSTLTGNLLPNIEMTDVLKTLFPCGSISGSPKQVTIDLINELEPYPREVYCGAIGYFSPNGEAIFNVPIRTVTIDLEKNRATYGAGGAITAQSDVEEEYEEMVTKTKVLELHDEHFELLETFGVIDGKYILFDMHMERLIDSAAYFDFTLDVQSIKNELTTVLEQHPTGQWRVRLTVSEQGVTSIDCMEVKRLNSPTVAFSQRPINKENVFHYHKTTQRTIYEEHINKDTFDTILWNDKNEVTEFTIGNIVIEQNGEYCTPPIECGVLPGTYRKAMLQSGMIKEKVIYKNDLTPTTTMWLINSVRGWIQVHFDTKKESL